MPVSCKSSCGRNAVLKRPKTGDALCKECFFWAFETEIHHTITLGGLFKRGDTVAVAASGGKDSTVLAHVLKTLNEQYDYGLKLVLLSIDEGITGYRDDSLETVKRNRDDYGMDLKILSYEDLYGWTMDKIVAQIGKKNNCTFCGVFRRQALDRGAEMLKVDCLATGHNADDIAETVIMNILRGDIARLQRCTSLSTECEGAIPRVKPLKYTYEKEIVMYAYFKRLVYFSTECIYAPNAYRGHARAFLKDLEKIRPSSIIDIIHSGEQLTVKSGVGTPKRGCCSQCGFVSSQSVCKACTLLQGLNKGLPKLAIGKSSKSRQLLTCSSGCKNSKGVNFASTMPYSSLYDFSTHQLSTVSLGDLVEGLSNGLKKNFKEVCVEVVDCPDLRQPPFHLVREGLGGLESIIDLGGPENLLPLVNRGKVYDFKDLVHKVFKGPRFIVGAGAGPFPFIGKNSEMVANVYVNSDQVEASSHIGKVSEIGEKAESVVLPKNETRFALMGNYFVSEGTPSKVLKIRCKNRIGETDFITSIRTTLSSSMPDETIGMGGVFLLKEGKAKQHVMPDFSETPINTEEGVNKWLRFYNMSAPLVALGTLVSKDIPDLQLRVQHFHSFGEKEAGHYHNDTTPTEAEYLAYFNIASVLYRIDKPKEFLKLGRN